MKFLAFIALACACSSKSDAPPPDKGSATVEIKPYTPSADVPEAIKQAIAAPDRAADDRALDAGRKPGEVLMWFRIGPGQRVAELFAGGGATTELLARVVGDKGQVFAQNTKEILDRFARKPWTDRAAKPVMKNVVAVERPLDEPLPPEAKDLDAVVMVLNYHDSVWMKVDRAKMNAAVFAALKSGGVYGIVDHSAAAGSGTRDCETLHRIDEDVVKKEITAAGFKLDAESDMLRNSEDKRDWNASPRKAGERRGTSDRFVLRFLKP
jgi:predicted methyltransferase